MWADVNAKEQENIFALKSGSWSTWDGAVDLGAAGIFRDAGESWATAADGGYDKRWTTMLQNLKSYRGNDGTVYLRFAQEFNTPVNWTVQPGEVEHFKEAWARLCELRNQYFPEARLVWGPNDVTTTDLVDARLAFPGCVDVIGLRTHNEGAGFVRSASDFKQRWEATLDGGIPVGPEQWRRFAEQMGVPAALSDWASSGGSGDSPEYFRGVHDWLREHGGSDAGQVLYEIYVQVDSTFRVYPDGGSQPDASSVYRDLW